MRSNAGTSNAVKILHRRYVGDDAERNASLREERCNAEVEAWRAGADLIRCERFGATMTPDACRRYRKLKPHACKACAGGRPDRRLREVERPAEKITGARVREVRIARGLTQASLAKRLNISPQLVSAWETGKVEIYKDYLPKLEKWIVTGKWR